MKKVLILLIACLCLFSCEKDPAETTEAIPTTEPAVTTEPVAQSYGFTVDGITFAEHPCEGFEPLFVHKVFPSGMGNCIVFGLVEDKPKEVFAFYTENLGDNFGKKYTKINCNIPSDFEYDYAIPVCAGNGGGSAETHFIVMFQKGESKSYAQFNNYSWTNYTDWHDFVFDCFVTDSTDYYYEELINSPLYEKFGE